MHEESLFRWIVGAALLANLSLSAYFRRKARTEGGTIERKEEAGHLIVLRVGGTLPLLAALLAYLIHPPWMAWAQVSLPAGVRWAGAFLALGAVPFSFWVFRSIGRNISETVLVKPTHELVTNGPYRWIRHPLYTGGLMLLTGISLAAANGFLALWTLSILVLILRVVIPKEEHALVERFGEAYRLYRRGTGRLLPTRIHRTLSGSHG